MESLWLPAIGIQFGLTDVAARLQPLVIDQYKPRQHQTFAIEKIPRFDRNNPIMSWGQIVKIQVVLVKIV